MGLNIFLRDSLTIEVHKPKHGLCFSIPLFRSLAVPLRCFGIILRNSLTIEVHIPEVELRSGISLFSKRFEYFQRFFSHQLYRLGFHLPVGREFSSGSLTVSWEWPNYIPMA